MQHYFLNKNMNNKISIKNPVHWLLPLFAVISLLLSINIFGQNKKNISKKGSAFQSRKYRNVFAEAGYNQSAIDEKVDKVYKDLFEGPQRIYFEVGDSCLLYTSDA